ncbi:MAG TPA: hypothetical protein VLJ15_06705 [Gammaproteobacteria bacterium]|nr:hypothetical protein [Gammaproteobacteria bacterium]
MAGTYKTPGYVQNSNQLKAGDIIVFHEAPHYVSNIISFFSRFTSAKHGHHDSTHTSIYMDETNGKPNIAHIIGGKGLVIEPLENYCDSTRAFMSFRPKNELMANDIVRVVDKVKHETFTYSETQAARSIFSGVDDGDKIRKTGVIAKNTFCSRFVADVIGYAARSLRKRNIGVSDDTPQLMPIHVSPKTLESYLYNSPHYDLHVYPGSDDPYREMRRVIRNELDAMLARGNGNAVAREKYNTCATRFNEIYDRFNTEEKSNLNQFEKAHYLFSEMMPLLQVRSGLFAATSAKNILSAARNMRLFGRDVKQVAPPVIASEAKQSRKSI